METQRFDCIVLGAGASGLVCGAAAARRGRRVAILDHAAKPARKLLISGGGKCNLTNLQLSFADYAGENPQFARSALARLTPAALLEEVRGKGIALEEREHGQIFCKRSAHDMAVFLMDACREAGCSFFLGRRLVAVEYVPGAPGFFRVRAEGSVYEAAGLVVATGGRAWPQVGATALGYQIGMQFGHRIVPQYPALVGLTMPAGWPCAHLAGIAVPVSLYLDAQPAPGETRRKKAVRAPWCVAADLPLLFTHQGISGPAVLQASLFWKKGQSLLCRFLPPETLKALYNASGSGKLLVKNLFRQHLPARLAEAVIPPRLGEKKVAELARQERGELYTQLCALPLRPTGTEGYRKAEATGGGVSTEEISSRTMESKRVAGLFFCGEVLDITGRLGGYNLHWAFASGYAAGLHV